MYRLYRTMFVMDLHRRLTVQESLLLADLNTARGRHRLESNWRHGQVLVRGGTTGTSDRWRSICVSFEFVEHHFWVCDQLRKRFSLIYIHVFLIRTRFSKTNGEFNVHVYTRICFYSTFMFKYFSIFNHIYMFHTFNSNLP